jgi:hypothetical protein
MGTGLINADDDVESGGEFLKEHLQHGLVTRVASAEETGNDECAIYRDHGWI